MRLAFGVTLAPASSGWPTGGVTSAQKVARRKPLSPRPARPANVPSAARRVMRSCMVNLPDHPSVAAADLGRLVADLDAVDLLGPADDLPRLRVDPLRHVHAVDVHRRVE